MKFAGAAYLVYLGIRRIVARQPAERIETPAQPLSHLFRQGVVVNVLNPKTALFFLAFLPQFVDPARGQVGGQILVLGLMFVVLGVVSDGLYAVLAGAAGGWLKRDGRVLRAERYVTGSVFVGLGLTAAFAGDGRK